jgi:hypothetical protein
LSSPERKLFEARRKKFLGSSAVQPEPGKKIKLSSTTGLIESGNESPPESRNKASTTKTSAEDNREEKTDKSSDVKNKPRILRRLPPVVPERSVEKDGNTGSRNDLRNRLQRRPIEPVQYEEEREEMESPLPVAE